MWLLGGWEEQRCSSGPVLDLSPPQTTGQSGARSVGSGVSQARKIRLASTALARHLSPPPGEVADFFPRLAAVTSFEGDIAYELAADQVSTRNDTVN